MNKQDYVTAAEILYHVQQHVKWGHFSLAVETDMFPGFRIYWSARIRGNKLGWRWVLDSRRLYDASFNLEDYGQMLADHLRWSIENYGPETRELVKRNFR